LTALNEDSGLSRCLELSQLPLALSRLGLLSLLGASRPERSSLIS
jgi:hypothetical protein